MQYYQRSSISMFVNSVIKKQLRKGTFTVPYSWSFANEIERQSGSGNRSYSDVPPDSSGSKEDIVKKSQRIEDNPFYNRYADKIKRVVHQEGRNISERIDKNIQLIDSMNKIPEPERIKTKPKSKSGREESTEKIGGFPGNKCLKDLVNLDMLLKLDAESIAQVWNQHHKSKENCIFSVIPVEKYRTIYENGRQYPSFIYLLPKDNVNKDQAKPDECYQIFLGQFSNHQVHFTSLASYHLRQENATSEMTMWHFPELSGEKGIVLMHGSFDDKKLNSIEAQCLANQLQIYYDGRDLTKSLLLHKFNKAPDSFDYLDAIQEFEKGLL